MTTEPLTTEDSIIWTNIVASWIRAGHENTRKDYYKYYFEDHKRDIEVMTVLSAVDASPANKQILVALLNLSA